MNAVTIVGCIGATTSCLMFVPQMIRVLKLRDQAQELVGVSMLSKAIAMLNSIMWVTYAILSHDLWVGSSSGFNFLVNSITVYYVLRSRRFVNGDADAFPDA